MNDDVQDSLIGYVHDRFDKILKPTGTRQYPARTCADLYHDHPELESGTS